MLASVIKLLRVHQWLKNLMLFFPPFLAGTLFTDGFSRNSLFSFTSFCLASSATYVINDLFDREKDSHHPEKRSRPISSGQVSPTAAQILVAVLFAASVLAARNLSNSFLFVLSTYVLVSVAYSAKLKDIVLVDVFCISAGFLLRLLAGGIAFSTVISEWLFLSVFLLAVFLSTGKRLSEKRYLGDTAHHHRKALACYPKGYLEGVMHMTGSAVLVTYTMYVIARHSSLLLYSVPLCCFGLLRYILRVQSGNGGDPTESLLSDVPLFVVGFVWLCIVGWGIYG